MFYISSDSFRYHQKQYRSAQKMISLSKIYIILQPVTLLQNFTNTMVTTNINSCHVTLKTPTSKELYRWFYSEYFHPIIIYRYGIAINQYAATICIMF